MGFLIFPCEKLPHVYIPDRVSDEDEKQGYRHIPHPLGNRISSQMHNVVTSTMAIHGGLKPPLQQVVNGVNQAKSNGNSNSNAKQNHQYQQSPHHHQHNHSGTSIKGRELEDPATKANMKAMAARALWQLAKGNSPICRSITESRAQLCFAVLLEKGSEDVQLNSAMALMEITAVAEKDAELRRSAFKPNSSACKSEVDQLQKIIEKADADLDLLIPCIKAVGNLARTFRATETRMIGPLVRLLDEREAEVTREATIALTKFACTEVSPS
ncbi:PREDICTED: Armadillo [Prunus dulcis]|uniref:PREDICTED: Armadillo n=1 Tax=Prunus dulcis TaxID=3755 RepID=A0A5E4E291_PRUDU|nr:PREDICTED: Armadillo [Prunus dulcis]